jgi:hypothetical protein
MLKMMAFVKKKITCPLVRCRFLSGMVVLFLLFCVDAYATQGETIRIIYSGNFLGEILPCG